MPYIIILCGIIVLLIFWIMSVQRSLIVLDVNINNAMSQIGLQISSRWDALASLLDLIKNYSEPEYITLREMIKARRSITKYSTPEDIYKQEKVIAEARGKIMAVAELYPELKSDKNYIKIMDAVNQYENMILTSRLIFNDSIAKMNRAIGMFPVSLVAGMLGFSRRIYLEA